MQPLCLDDLSFLDQVFFMFVEFRTDRSDRALDRLFGHHIVRFGIDRYSRIVLFYYFAQQRIDSIDGIDLVAPELDPVCLVLIARVQFDHVTPHAKITPIKIDIDAFVLQLDQLLQKLLAFDLHSLLDEHQHPEVGVRIAKPVDTRDRRDDDHITTLEQRPGRR